jgi:16S rRNA (guanine527-N7)-methyltransferase
VDATPCEPAEIAAGARDLGLDLTMEQARQLARYTALLQRWNRVHNLTALVTGESVLTHHLLDSLAAALPIQAALEGAFPGEHPHLLDAGSGGGLPGIPLAITRPAWHFTLVDAVEKKAAFLLQAALDLGLPQVRAFHQRLEASQVPEFHATVSRAFSSLADFVRLTRPRILPGGLWLAMKGRRPEAEIAALPADVEVSDIVTLHVPRLGQERHLVVMRARTRA